MQKRRKALQKEGQMQFITEVNQGTLPEVYQEEAAGGKEEPEEA